MSNSTSEAPTTDIVVDLTYGAVDNLDNPAKHDQWWKAVLAASLSTLIEATSRIHSLPIGSTRAAVIKGHREAVISEIERRNSDNVIQTMRSLDRATEKLTWVGIALAVIGVIVAIVQVLHELYQ
jgi:hypothetical protein